MDVVTHCFICWRVFVNDCAVSDQSLARARLSGSVFSKCRMRDFLSDGSDCMEIACVSIALRKKLEAVTYAAKTYYSHCILSGLNLLWVLQTEVGVTQLITLFSL